MKVENLNENIKIKSLIQLLEKYSGKKVVLKEEIELKFKLNLWIANWENYIHPSNPDFMQLVRWTADWNPETKEYKIAYNLEHGKFATWVEIGEVESKESFLQRLKNSPFYEEDDLSNEELEKLLKKKKGLDEAIKRKPMTYIHQVKDYVSSLLRKYGLRSESKITMLGNIIKVDKVSDLEFSDFKDVSFEIEEAKFKKMKPKKLGKDGKTYVPYKDAAHGFIILLPV